MKKDFLNLKRSRWLLLSLFALLVGASPTWAETLTENFNSLTVSGTTLSNGWFVQGATLSSSGSSKDNWGNAYYELVGRDADGTDGKSLVATYGSQTGYIIIPQELTGTISFSIAGTKYGSSNKGSYAIYPVTKDGDNYTVGSTAIKSGTVNAKSNSSASFGTWNTVSFDYSDHSMIALWFNKAAIDNFSADIYEQINGPALTVKDGTAKISSVYSYAFGLATAGTTHEFTLSNPGTESVTLNIVASNGFGVSPANVTIAAGGEETLTVTMADATATGAVTIASTSDGIDDFVINVSGTIRDANKVYLDFADGLMPDGWTSVAIGSYASSYGSPWSASTGYVSQSGSSSSYEWAFTSPLLTFAKDELIAFETEKYSSSSWYTPSIKVEYSLDGTTWTTIGSAYTDDVADAWTSRSVTIPVEGVKYIRFSGWYMKLRNIYGGEKPAGANFAIDTDGSTQNLGVASIGGVAEKKFTITNSGNADLPVTFTDATDFYVAKTVMFTKPNSWTGDKLYMYAWDGSGALTAAYPGYEVTEAAQNDMSEWVYTVRLPKGATGIKFSDNASHETGDISTEGFKDVVGLWLDGSTIQTWKNENFSVPAKDGETNGSADFYVRMDSKSVGAKSGNINLAFEAVNGTDFTIPVSGYVFDASKYTVDFDDNQLPDGWTNGTNGGSSWTFANGEAYGQYANYKNAKMTSPLLTVAEGESMVFGVKGNTDYANMKVKVSDKAGNSVKTFTFDDEARAAYSAGSFRTVMISGLEAGDYRLEFEAYNTYIDNIIGFEINQNDPKMGVYTDAECTVAAATSVTRDFNFVAEAPAAFTYYIKNDGTGTMNLTKNAPAGFNVTLDKTAVAAGEHATLTIAFDVNKGYHGGNVVVTAEGLGDFTVAVSGVVIDENKFDLDFTTADIPATWTKNSWEKNSNGYVEVGYNSSSMQTSTLVAEANETLVVLAKQSYTSTSYTFGVKYRQVGEVDWNDLIPAANIGTNDVLLHGTIGEAGNYELQFTGNYTQIQRIYGLSKPNAPEMVVYDGVAVAGASYSFNKVTDEADAEAVFTVKNEGKAKLEGLTAVLSGTNAEHYNVAITGATGDGNDEIEAGAQATITVTQLKDNLGAHEATLTISATGLDDKVIALSGTTVDHTILDVDFNSSNEWPAGILSHGVNWTVYNYSGSGEARQSSTSEATALTLTPLTVANAEDKLTFKTAYYTYQSSYKELTVSYTTNGGVTWTDYNFGTPEEPVTKLTTDIPYALTEKQITGIPVGTVAFKFVGKSIKLDDFAGDMKTTTAPLVDFVTVSDNISGQNLKADATAEYTLANNGNADYVGTVALTNVTAEVAGEGVTYEAGTLTVPAGKTATITVTMAYAAPYGEKTGSMAITSDSWVGDINVAYTAELVDPTNFVEDFSGNAKPAGWYSESWTYSGSEASIYTGVAKPMITEKIEATSTKNVLSFDAKVASGSDEQTLNVYTSTDRKTWSEAQTFNLTAESQTFKLAALADGEYYVKFEAANATVDNIKGVKKLTAPTTDLYLVSSSMPTENVTPGSSYTATVNVASLIAAETVKAELYFGGSKVAETEQQVGTTSTAVSLTGEAPAAGTYNVYAKVYVAETSVQTEPVQVVVADTRILEITEFVRTSEANVQADENNKFTATFDVTVKNNGTASLAANEVSVTLTNGTDAYENGTFTWTAENSDVLYMNTTKDAIDLAANDAKLGVWMWGKSAGEWGTFTKINEGFYSVDLKGNTGFIVVRQDPTQDFDLDTNWGKTADMSLAAGNIIKINSYDAGVMNFTSESMGYLEPTMSTTLKVSVTLSAGEGGSFSFKAKENVSDTEYFGSQSVNVTPYVTVALNETTTYDATEAAYGKVTLYRPFIAGWNTLVLPFDVDAATFATKFGTGAKLFAFESNTNGELTFTKVEDGIKAGTPYLLSLEAAISEEMTFTGVTVLPGTTLYQHDANSNGAWFKGNYVNGFDMEGKHGVTPSGTVQKGGAGSTMKAFRAYITMPAGQNARIAIFDETTGVSRILSAKEMSDLNMFNMQGQRVNNNAKGVIIKDGKKIVRK